jgi:hypothetical protein
MSALTFSTSPIKRDISSTLQKLLTFCNFNSKRCKVQRSSTSLAKGFSVNMETVILILEVSTKAIPFDILNF